MEIEGEVIAEKQHSSLQQWQLGDWDKFYWTLDSELCPTNYLLDN